MKVNEEQKEVARTIDGPILILASAGTGKTTSLVYRLVEMIKRGIPHNRILCLTFTNRAADIMSKKVRENVGPHQVEISTFHSFCYRLLKRVLISDSKAKKFVVIDDSDQRKIIRDVIADLHCQKYGVPDALSQINLFKRSLKTTLTVEQERSDDEIVGIYKEYQNKIEASNTLDFGDLIYYTVLILRTNASLRKLVQGRYRYIMIDEYQDTNHAQFILASLLAGSRKNICVVGDDSQCLAKGSMLNTPTGTKKVENVKVGDQVETLVQTSYCRGTSFKPITAKSKAMLTEIIEVQTKSGHTMRVSSNHKVFATLPSFESCWYLYLMYRSDKGYRLGVTRGGRYASLMARTQQEGAKKLWLLKRCETRAEACHLEVSHSLEYRVPTCPYFHAGRSISMTQHDLDNIFEQYGTNGIDILLAYELSFGYPNFIPQNTTKVHESVRNVNLYLNTAKGLCGVTFESDGCRTRKQFSGSAAYLEARKFAETVCGEQEASGIIEKLDTDSGYVSVIPATGLMLTMRIPVIQDGNLILSEIVSINNTHGTVYDLEIGSTGILIADGVVSHNSIYGFQGAEVRNILKFTEIFPGAKTVILKENYRSIQPILTAADHVIRNNKERTDKEFVCTRYGTTPLEFTRADTEYDEALKIGWKILDLHDKEGVRYQDIAILYRSNWQSKAIENVFRQLKLPYEVVDSTSFYDRTEIKDLMAFLQFFCNPDDSIHLERIINVPRRGIGKKSVDRLKDYAKDHTCSLWEAVKQTMPGSVVVTLFQKYIDTDKSNVYNFTLSFLEDIHYLDSLLDEDRKDRVRELLEDMKTFRVRVSDESIGDTSVDTWLGISSLASATDGWPEDDKIKLLTIHSSKGTEFDVVFVTGMEEGTLPHFRSIEDGLIEEERRLCYVAVTRAKDRLFLSHCTTRSYAGRTSVYPRSRFLDEMKCKE